MPEIDEGVVLGVCVELDVDVDPCCVGVIASLRFDVASRWCSQMITVFGDVGSCFWTWGSVEAGTESVGLADSVFVDSSSCHHRF